MKIATLVMLSVMMMAPSATLFSSPQRDKPGEVDRAERSLQTAKNELERAGTEWGGHRVQAIKHIDAALHELEEAVGTRASRHQVRLATRPRSQAAHSGDAAISVRLSTSPISP